MKLIFVLLSCLIGLQALAGTREDAFKICQQLPFQSDQDACARKLRNFHYFDNDALAICDSLDFPNDKAECLPLIGDKEYEKYEIKTCLAQPFPAEKVTCLKDSGVPIQSGACADKNMILSYLRNAKFDLGQGHWADADSKLTFLINTFQNCR